MRNNAFSLEKVTEKDEWILSATVDLQLFLKGERSGPQASCVIFGSQMSMLSSIELTRSIVILLQSLNKTTELTFLGPLHTVDLNEQKIDVNMIFFVIEKQY